MKITTSFQQNSNSQQNGCTASRSAARGLGKLLIATAALLFFTSQQTFASDPIGVYAVIDKLVFEPNERSPERIQIWGIFSLAEGSGNEYRSPEAGYLYYQLPKEKPELAKREWNDLKTLAGKLEAVGFGARYKENGKTRKTEEKPASPDLYPVGFGLTHISKPPKSYPALQRLFEAARKHRAEKS